MDANCVKVIKHGYNKGISSFHNLEDLNTSMHNQWVALHGWSKNKMVNKEKIATNRSKDGSTRECWYLAILDKIEGTTVREESSITGKGWYLVKAKGQIKCLYLVIKAPSFISDLSTREVLTL